MKLSFQKVSSWLGTVFTTVQENYKCHKIIQKLFKELCEKLGKNIFSKIVEKLCKKFVEKIAGKNCEENCQKIIF